MIPLLSSLLAVSLVANVLQGIALVLHRDGGDPPGPSTKLLRLMRQQGPKGGPP